MKSRHIALVFLPLCVGLIAACNKPPDFTGFWKANCTDAFGLQIQKQTGNLFSVSFCGPGGCFAPGEWTPNTPIVGDAKYRVLNPRTIEIGNGQNWTRYTKCTTDTNPRLDYSTMPTSNNENNGGTVAVEMNNEKSNALPEKDPHRPPCTDSSCKKIKAFLKKNYCGASPFANGPDGDDSCDLRDNEKRSADIKVIADYNCEWDETKNETECKQNGQVSPELRGVLVRKLEQLGMPAKGPVDIFFKVWQANRSDWLLTQAYYSHRAGNDIELCEVIAVIDKNAQVTVVRKLPFKKTDIDVPDVTDWTLLDITDTRGDGQLDIVLQGDAYEDHWLEVISWHDGSAKTIFSGLGYYL